MAEADLELKYAHLGWRNTPKRKANREHLQKMIAEWQACCRSFESDQSCSSKVTTARRLAV